MNVVIPAPSNYDITDSSRTIKVVIRKYQVDTSAKVVGFGFLSFWILVGAYWVFFLSPIINEIMNSWTMAITLLLVWVLIGAFVVCMFVLRFTFQEAITINNESINVEYKSWLFDKVSYQYLSKHIHGLRSSPLPPTTFWSGRIAFDYGGKTVYIGGRLNESEAQHILSRIEAKFDNYDFFK